MNEKIEKLKEWWGGLEENSKRMIFLVPLILAFVIYVIPRSASTGIGGYQPLYQNIPVEKASAAANYLDEKGIQYQLKNNGQTIYVERGADVNRLKLALAEQDILPKEEMPGNNLLVGGSSFGEGEETIKVKKKIALEQNLASIVSSYEQVQDAKVLITMAVQSAFVRTTDPAKASVTLTLKRGESLGGEQVKGISRIVANAVPGLVPDQVAITDQFGNPLSSRTMGSIGKATDQLEYQQKLEESLAAKAQITLNRVLGPNQAKVNVNAELFMEETVRRSRTVDPENRVKEEEEIFQIKDRRGAPGGLGGLPGTDTNISERLPLLRQALGTEDREETRKTIKYKLNESIQIDKILPGEIKRLAVALTLSEKVQLFADQDDFVYQGKTYQKGEFVGWATRKASDKQDIEDLVKNMVGFNQERGDTFTTQLLPFYENRHAPPLLLPGFFQRYWAEGAVSLLAFLGVLGILAVWRSKVKAVNRYKEELKIAESPNVEVSMEIQKLASNIVHNPKVIADALQAMMEDKPVDQALQNLGPAPKVQEPVARLRNRAAVTPTIVPQSVSQMETVVEGPQAQPWSPPQMEHQPTAVQQPAQPVRQQVQPRQQVQQPRQQVQQPPQQVQQPPQQVQETVVREQVPAEQVPAE